MKAEGTFLFQKSVFLLAPSVGKGMAETLMKQAMAQIGVSEAALTQSDIVSLAAKIEPALRPFVGDDKARRLASALRVLVGGVVGTTK